MTTIPLRGSADYIRNPLLGEPFHFVTPIRILEYIKAIRIDPKYATAHYNLAREFYTIRYYQGALKELEIAARLSPKQEYLERLEEVKRKIMQ